MIDSHKQRPEAHSQHATTPEQIMRLRSIEVSHAVQNGLDSLDQTINGYAEPMPLPKPYTSEVTDIKQPPELTVVTGEVNSDLANIARSGIEAAFDNPLLQDAA